VHSIKYGGTILDVGCGNNSPFMTKSQRPDLSYVGIDVGDFNQEISANEYANAYLVCDADEFSDTIAKLGARFDGVISSHNIEHCNDPSAVLAAMFNALLPGGSLFMAWPAEHTTSLPHRAGTLNFHDDPTHRNLPGFDFIVSAARDAGCVPIFSTRAYRPPIPFILGALLEPVSRWQRRVMPFRATWALYGFEAVIWFRKYEDFRKR
jgi:SAM-dependent methyltransferase